MLESISSWQGDSPIATFSLSDCWSLRSGKEHINRKESRLVCEHITPGEEKLCLPMYAQGEIVGVISQTGLEEARLLRAFAERVALSLANINLKIKLQALSSTDPLTGLYNRRRFQELAEREIQRANRTKSHMSLLFMDIDHFKSFNDTFGHETGDSILKAVGDHLKKTFRNTDISARWGGEEFVVLLTDAELGEGLKRADRLREEIEKMPAQRPFTISVGVSNFPLHTDNLTTLVVKADDAMYKSKAGGRNRVTAAE
jgi:diguanylate cyclase (GGDEF)-like protein